MGKPIALRVARATADISQLELSRRAGLGEKIVWSIENGYRVGTPAEREAITTALGIAVSAVAWPTGKTSSREQE